MKKSYRIAIINESICFENSIIEELKVKVSDLRKIVNLARRFDDSKPSVPGRGLKEKKQLENILPQLEKHELNLFNLEQKRERLLLLDNTNLFCLLDIVDLIGDYEELLEF